MSRRGCAPGTPKSHTVVRRGPQGHYLMLYGRQDTYVFISKLALTSRSLWQARWSNKCRQTGRWLRRVWDMGEGLFATTWAVEATKQLPSKYMMWSWPSSCRGFHNVLWSPLQILNALACLGKFATISANLLLLAVLCRPIQRFHCAPAQELEPCAFHKLVVHTVRGWVDWIWHLPLWLLQYATQM